MRITDVDISKIKPNPYQTRTTFRKESSKALVQSIMQRGLINPISVLKNDDEYLVISGHRRLGACKSLKWKTMPCIVKDREINNELIIDLVHENLVREDLTPIEKGMSIKLLMSQIKGTRDDVDRMIYLIHSLKNYQNRGRKKVFKTRLTGFDENDIFLVDKILREINITCNTAVIYLEILKLPDYIQKELSFKKRGYNTDGKVSISQAQQLVRVEDKNYQKYLFQRAINGTNQKRLQALINEYKKKLEKGEWFGQKKIKRMIGANPFLVNQIVKAEEISKDCQKLSSRLRSFSIDTLRQLEETLEGEEFIVSMKELNKELILVRNRIYDKLADKGCEEIQKKILPFEIVVRPPTRKVTSPKPKAKFEKRFTFPMEITKEINIPRGKSARIKMKIVGVEVIK